MKTEQIWKRNGYVLRPAQWEDAEDYYTQNFCPLEPEIARLTGSRTVFSRDEVVGFFRQCISAEDRYDFLLIAPDGRILGECVINEIDWDLRCGNFRIVIFHERDCGKGLGSFMTESVRDFAFETLRLHRLELDVFSFNPRAEQTYLRAGFRREGVLREAVRDGNGYGDDILMAMLETEWQTLRQNR